jgi:hypothetical protein
VSVTLLPDEVTLLIVSPFRFSALLDFSRLYVNTTSAGVNGVPLFHFTPWRIANVSDLPPLPHV